LPSFARLNSASKILLISLMTRYYCSSNDGFVLRWPPLVLRKLSLLLRDGVDDQASLQPLLDVVENDILHL
jgi:hypothetical protein